MIFQKHAPWSQEATHTVAVFQHPRLCPVDLGCCAVTVVAETGTRTATCCCPGLSLTWHSLSAYLGVVFFPQSCTVPLKHVILTYLPWFKPLSRWTFCTEVAFRLCKFFSGWIGLLRIYLRGKRMFQLSVAYILTSCLSLPGPWQVSSPPPPPALLEYFRLSLFSVLLPPGCSCLVFSPATGVFSFSAS